MKDKNKKNKKRLISLITSYKLGSGINFIDDLNLPVNTAIQEILENLLEIIFPGYTGKRNITTENVSYIIGDLLCKVKSSLEVQIFRALKHDCRINNCENKCDCRDQANIFTEYTLDRILDIRELLIEDVKAAYRGDPAAKSLEEIVISYPGLKAIAIHRIAHELYKKSVPLIPRMMNEIAHSQTGIDIHPGAEIGKGFFIDHGTGVVIGETTIIGKNVKLYQGVTLGALSFAKDKEGNIIKGGKRHPTIDDNVVIYAEATILGDVFIGKGAVIGGNVWVKTDVDAGKTIGMSGMNNDIKTS
ncbi:MAG: serine acetyltransferase [Spirochaetaceae bacterium]|nr:serine acetyltransferase [Spirochaetaceae bacterium]